jgi:hypothetical protein
MNVNGPGSPSFPPPAVAPAATRPARTPAGPGDAPREAAPAAIHSLWDVLTADERAFFAEQAAIGPLTYGPGSARADAAPAPTGQRLDRTG